jgi:O-antigen/teichoic acid export membrane protein
MSVLRNVTILASGGAIAQVIALAASPILTRLYDPQAFGLLSVFMAVTSIIVSVSSLALDAAIVLPKRDEEASKLALLALFFTVIVAFICFLAIIVTGERNVVLLGVEWPRLWLLLLAPFILLAGVAQILTNWAMRTASFKTLSGSRLAQSIATASGQLYAGTIGLMPIGLLFGVLAGQVVAAGTLTLTARGRRCLDLSLPSLHEARDLVSRYRDFVRYRMPHRLFVAATSSTRTIALAAFFGPGIAGLFALTEKVLAKPTELIGESFLKAYYPYLANTIQENPELTMRLVRRYTVMILLVAAVPFILVIVFGPTLFSALFGVQWNTSGEMARYVSALYFTRLAAVPSHSAAAVLGLQRVQLSFEVLQGIASLSGLLIGAVYGSPLLALALFTTGGVITNGLFMRKVLSRSGGVASS